MDAMETIRNNMGKLILRQVELEQDIETLQHTVLTAFVFSDPHHPEEHAAEHDKHRELRDKRAELDRVLLGIDECRRDLVKECGILQAQLKMKLDGTLSVSVRQATHNLLQDVEKQIEHLLKLLNHEGAQATR